MDLTVENTSSTNELETILAYTAPRNLVSKTRHFMSVLRLSPTVIASKVNSQIKLRIFSEARN